MLDKRKNRGELKPYLANRDVRWGHCNVSDLSLMRFTEADQAKFDLRPGDLLVCEGGEVGRTAIWNGELADCYYQKAVHRLRSKRPLEPRFVLHYMKWAADRQLFARLTSATSIAHLTKEKLARAPLPLPPLPEQRRIAAILDKADAIRRKRRQAIELTEELLRSAFLEMFGDPVTNPKGWPVVELGELIAEIKAGWSAKGEDRPYGPSEHGVLKVSAVTSGWYRASEHKAVSDAAISKELVVPRRGDLLFSRANTRDLVAAACIVIEPDPKTFLPDKLWRITTDENRLRPEVLLYTLRHPRYRREITKKATGTSGSMLNVSQKKVREAPTLLPPAHLQERFSRLFWRAVDQRSRAIRAAEQADDLFHSLAQRAFRGEF